MADEPKPKPDTAKAAPRAKAKAKAAPRAPRTRRPADEPTTVASGPAVRTLTTNERETLRARLQKKFH